MSSTRLVLVLLLVASASTARAQPANWRPQPLAAPAPDDGPRVAVTLSPIHLILPVIELAAELRMASKLGVAVIAGAGGVRHPTTNDRITVLEGGISPRYYLLGSFRTGLQLGAEMMYLHANADDLTGAAVQAIGLAISPYLGYKWTHGSGFTLEAQGGVSFIAIRGESQSSSSSKDDIGPLVNLQLGWSF